METIKTFDSKIWGKQELLDNMYDDSFYYGYLGKNALSSSSAKMLINSPKTYKYVTQYGSDESQALRDGKLFHTMILEPHKLNDLVIVDVATKAGKEYKLAKEQITREPMKLPNVKVHRTLFEGGKPDPNKLDLDYYSIHNFELLDYRLYLIQSYQMNSFRYMLQM